MVATAHGAKHFGWEAKICAGVSSCHLFGRFPPVPVWSTTISRFLKGRDSCWLPCRGLLIQFRWCLQGNGFPDSALIFVFYLLRRWGVLLIIRRFISSLFPPHHCLCLFSYHKSVRRCAFWSIVCWRFYSIIWPLFARSTYLDEIITSQIFEGVFFVRDFLECWNLFRWLLFFERWLKSNRFKVRFDFLDEHGKEISNKLSPRGAESACPVNEKTWESIERLRLRHCRLLKSSTK